MKTKLKYVKQLCLLSLLALGTNLSNAQQSDSYSILFTGNTSEGLQDGELLKNWRKSSQKSENFAFLMLGNIYNPEKKHFQKNFF